MPLTPSATDAAGAEPSRSRWGRVIGRSIVAGAALGVAIGLAIALG